MDALGFTRTLELLEGYRNDRCELEFCRLQLQGAAMPASARAAVELIARGLERRIDVIDAAVGALPEDEKTVIAMTYTGNREPRKSIAIALKTSPRSVTRICFRAIERLQGLLSGTAGLQE